MSEHAYTVKPLPVFRRLMSDGMAFASQTHAIHGMIEVDVTAARRRLDEIEKETGESLSFTGLIIYCCAKAVDENKAVHAYRDWRNRLIIFDDVDISVSVERPAEGQVIQLLIQAANRKSIAAIHREIRQAQSQTVQQPALFRNARWYLAVPAFIRRFVIRSIRRAPHLLKKTGGTVMVTAVGMFSRGTGWGIPPSGRTLTVTVGGIVSRPVVNNAHVESRDHLCLTVSFDHDLIDGAPAAKFIQRFRELLESGSGLFEGSSAIKEKA